ncbi:tetraspanin-4 isoform X1 [Latimeria chalumnae]|uniref:Tetraspanin n=1 Tax=Latimeria chalumnae TaxID=7897 RepID=M3XI86_LATCH|nr:PREDICTED: tetraspanin-4-like isoform X1 [Latimeria chalumnae]|eukprot:XP_005990999.1 PREDICTED: tetraspanin-4-like isoform X1 [Latimeria chalumnae]
MSVSHRCLQVIKYLMFFFNLIFWLGGCGLLGVGVWLAATQSKFGTLSPTFPSLSAANLFMVTGSVIMIIGFIGCLGAVTERRCLLLSFFVVLCTTLLLEVIIGFLFLAYKEKFDSYAQDDLKKGLKLYDTDGNLGIKIAWDKVQIEFRCCGVTNYTDWFEALGKKEVPASCCPSSTSACNVPSSWWKEACYGKVKNWLANNMLSLQVFGICIGFIQVLGLVFSMIMYCHIKKVEKMGYN